MRTRDKLFAVGVIGLCASVGWSVPSAEPSGDFPLLACGSGRVFTLGAAGDEKPLAVGCGNVHRAVRFGGWTYYANSGLWRVPDGGGKAELVYRGTPRDNVYGFELRSDGTLVIACNAEERLLEFAAPGKDAKLPLERKDARLDIAVDTTSEDGKPTAPHTRLRMVRTTPAGTFLLGCGTSGMVREYDREGRLVWSHRAGGLVFEAVRLANGNTLVSNLKSLTEVTPDHRKVWSFTPADAPGEGLANLCSIFFLNDGTLLVGTYANGRPDGSRATAVIIDPRTKEVRWRHRPRTDRNMITISPLGPVAARPPQKPEGDVRIGFEDGAASGWKTTVGGPFPRSFTDRERQYGRDGGPTGKRGRFFLSTLEGWSNYRRDHATGVIESPTYRLAGPRVTFLIAGGKGAAFEAVDRLTGEVVASASGDGGQLLKEGTWDLAGSVGREIVFRARDCSEKDFLLLDDICFEGAEVEDDFTLRTEEWDMPARVAAFRAEVKELGAAHPGYPAEAFLKEAEAFAVPRQEPGFAAARARAARFDDLLVRALVRENPVVNGCEIAYVTYEQFKPEHHNTATIFQRGEINEAKYVTEGALRALDPKTGQVRDIVPRVAKRTVRDPEVDYDGRRIVLSARNGKDDDYHVYTVNADGSDYRQLTREKGVSDIDPAWLPDGDIVFSSTRNPKYCMCNRHIMCNLYRMKPDGANIHQIGVSTLFEGHSTVLADGRIMYDRWEYVDRNFGDAQGLWVCNQDGTRHAIYWGNNTGCPGGVINARQMPDGHVIAVLAACHDRPWGALGIIDRSKGVDGREPVLRTWPAWFHGRVNANGGFDGPTAVQRRFADPFPLDARHFIAVRSLPGGEETELVYLDLNGNEFAFHADAPGIHSPVLLRPSARPPVHPVQRNFEHPNAKGAFLVQDVYVGTHMKGVERGTIKALRIVESPEKRNWTVPAGWYGQGQMAPGMNWHSFENKRILGTVPVEDDGSAYFELPANTFVYFQALDAEGRMVQSMRSGAYVQPGEVFSCVGCHENRVTQAPPPAKAVKALQRAPSKLDGAYNLRGLERGTPPHLYSFQREVQPVFTRSCVACHDYGKPAGEKLNLSGDLGAFFCTSYVDLWALKYITCVGGGPAEIRQPYTWGAHASKLTQALSGHGGVKLSDDDRDRVVTWMDINAPYYPQYESAYPDNPGGRCPLTFRELGRLEALTGVKVSNSFAARQREQLDFVRPECSRILLGPGAATNAAARAEALAIVAKGKERLAQTPRGDMDGFVPCPKDREREAHYQRRLESERRAYESIREGRRTYDEAEKDVPLRIAALSDIHIYDWGSEKKGISPGEHGTLRSAFLYLRDRKIDAVTISGDLTGSKTKELAILGRLWREAFPDNKRPDGGHVEPIFIYGNHDGLLRSEEGQAAFKRECGLTWAPIYSVKVKGYAFICASWRCEKLLPAYIKEHEAELGLRENRPFFCLMHPYPRHALWAQDLDFDSESGAAAECLKDYPNAVVLCGHVHRASADDRSIWQGDYTAIDCGTFGSCTDERGCENTRPHPKGKAFHMPLDDRFGKQGMILDIWPDRIEVERRDFLFDAEVAPRCVLRRPVKGETPAYAYSEQTKRSVPPAWPAGAKIEVFARKGKNSLKQDEDQVVVRFPVASAAGHAGRVVRYHVEMRDGEKTLLTRDVAQVMYFRPLNRLPKTQDCVFGADEIPAGVTPTYRVTPVGVFGKEGAPLEGTGKREGTRR